MFLANKCENSELILATEKKKALELKQLGLLKAIYFGGVMSKELSPSAKLVLQGLACHFNPKKNFMFPSQKFLADKLGMNVRSVERAIKELKTQGLIEYETKKVNFYFFTSKFWGLIEDYFEIKEDEGESLLNQAGPQFSQEGYSTKGISLKAPSSKALELVPSKSKKERKDNRQNVGDGDFINGQIVGRNVDKLSGDDGQIVGQTNKKQKKGIKENLIKEREYVESRVKKVDWRPPEGVKYVDLKPTKLVWDENNPRTHLKTAREYVRGLWTMRENFRIKAKIDEMVAIWGAALNLEELENG